MTNSSSLTVTGRILTRHLRVCSGELSFHYYIKTHSGPVLVNVPHGEYVCFCSTEQVGMLESHFGTAKFRVQHLPLKSFAHEPVSAIYCHSSQRFRMLIRTATDLNICLFETDIRPEHRFLIERYIALDVEFAGDFINIDSSFPQFSAKRARKCSLDIPLKAISLDFECSMSGVLYSVGLYGVHNAVPYSKVIMISDCDSHRKTAGPEYIEWVDSEVALIHKLIAWFEDYDPDIIIGWAVVTFDLALLFRRANHHGIKLAIGRGGEALSWKVQDKYRPETLSLPGRVVLDGIDWLRAAFYQFDSFSLENVSRALLDEGKALPSGEKGIDNRGGEITELFKNDKTALAHYNLTDCRLVWEIFEKTELFEFAIERSRLTGLELGRVGGSVAAFNNLYLPHLHRAGFVAPPMATSQGLESPGGYVMDSLPGLYQNIVVLDFKSLYPSIIRTFMIDPKGLVQGLTMPESETVAGFLGGRFSREDPILPQLIKTLSEHREKAKRERNAPLSQAIKIIMNSLYGVLGSRGCVFHDARLASSITLRGHEIMKQTKVWIEECGYQVIYGDTDSTFVWLGADPLDFDVDVVAKGLVEKVNSKWQHKLAATMNIECFLELEYESHYEQFFMPTLRGSIEGSKKRYVGAYTKPDGELKLTFKGMEQVRSDWSPLARRVQEALYYRLFTKQDVTVFLLDVINDLLAGKLDSELIFSKRLRRDICDYTAKSSPHVKAAQIQYQLSGLESLSKKGTRIDYLMTINGAEPVKYRQAKIDYQYYIEKQLGPIADPILTILGENFSNLISKQLPLI
ncbi:DNA polymerase II [Shewanella sp. D64]|uniref:DNA polymerase II n=1 Tax=unclassified Shewanella TaxID=196818 RepID=UPI0022BA4D82|nr:MULTISPECIES: DNA polymerase II [unclassified Shewanella]MEC4726020.1 DNA polymerase II [Shewanella sp. D64]MEC4737275.1 DNA polymerase II [Shewanella sp. E94]WBJ93652.1 DNA polymerase II [Shewanella sp. MTB7]